MSKIFTTTADCIVLDCEDGVALNRKQEARENIRNLFENDSKVENEQDVKYSVRINAPNSGLTLADINTIFGAKRIPSCVFVPKTNSPDDVKWLFANLDKQLKTRSKPISLFFYMESAQSLINLNEIIKTSLELNSNEYGYRYNLEGFVFGSDDYCADIGAERTKDAAELVFARQKMVAYCKAYKLKAIDMVYIDFKGVRF